MEPKIIYTAEQWQGKNKAHIELKLGNTRVMVSLDEFGVLKVTSEREIITDADGNSLNQVVMQIATEQQERTL